MKLIVFSDSHGNNDNINRILKKEKFDLSIHAGDHQTSQEYMIKNFDYWVAGNNDVLGENEVVFNCSKYKIWLCHGHLYTKFSYTSWIDNLYSIAKENKIHLVIFGHSHFPDVIKKESILIVNPGSTQYPRGSVSKLKELDMGLVPTYAIIDIEKEIKVEVKPIID